MVHRNGGTLTLPQNDIQQKPLIENPENLDIPPIFTDSKKSSQILDPIEPCVTESVATKSAVDKQIDKPILLASAGLLDTRGKKIKKPIRKRVPQKKTRARLVQSTLKALIPETKQNGNKKVTANRMRSCRLRSNSVGNPRKSSHDNVGTSVAQQKPQKRGQQKIGKQNEPNDISLPTILRKSNSVGNLPSECDLLISSATKLTCSLPLEKLSAVMMSIMASSSCSRHLSDARSSTEEPLVSTDVKPVSITDDIFGLSSQTAKLLCLYCDKKFTSQKLRIKHTERVHSVVQGRRLSSRNSISCPSILAYPGCSFCCNGNSNSKLTTTTVSDDLKSLFHHLIEVHSDKYFACRPCAIRFPTTELLSLHFVKKHSLGRMSRSASLANSKMGVSKRCKNAASPQVVEVEITQPLHVDVGLADRTTTYDDDENESHPESTPTKTRRQIKQAMENKPLTTRSCHNSLRNDETILSRLGVAQNRLPRGRKGTRNRRLVNMELIKPEAGPSIVKTRTKVGRVVTSSGVCDISEQPATSRTATNNRVEPLCCTFDDDFYETVSLNVRQNLSCHLDGKLESGPTSPSPLSPVATVPAIRSTVVRSPLDVDSEIHEATALAAVTAFPTLLTAEQYGSDLISAAKIKKPITKHSWKWKWDCVKKYKYVNEGGKIVKKIKHPIAGLRDLSKLDMWTQLTMRTKHEVVRKQTFEVTGLVETLAIGEAAREEKRKQIAQLNSILDTRRLPKITLEQNELTTIKVESGEAAEDSPVLALEMPEEIENSDIDNDSFPQMLQLNRRSAENSGSQESLVLSGEWARPRCYICFGCGWKFDKLKKLEEHKISRHPYVYSTHYEIVGRELIEGNLYKNLYIPVKALNRHNEYKQIQRVTKIEDDPSVVTGSTSSNGTAGGEEESMDSVNSLSASTTSVTGVTTTTSMVSSPMEESAQTGSTFSHFSGHCTKCKRECNGQLELYRHMLDCSGDYAWRLAKKRKYRYFGVKSRRTTRQNFGGFQRRKVIKGSPHNEDADDSSSLTKSSKCNPSAPRPPRPSDAESIRRMLENLPAKRACRQIIPNVTKPRVRKFTKTLGLKKALLVNGACNKKGKGKNVHVASTTVIAISKNMRRNRKRLIARQLTRRTGKMVVVQEEVTEEDGIREGLKPSPSRRLVKRLTQKFQPIKQKLTVRRSANILVRKSRRIESYPLPEEEIFSVGNSDNVSQLSSKKKVAKKATQAIAVKILAETPALPEIILEPTPEIEAMIPQSSITDLSKDEIQALEIDCPEQPLNLTVPLQTFPPLNQVSPVTKRRGKKLTDCIAKLQEKLGRPFFPCNENLDTVLSANSQSVNETATMNIPPISPQITVTDLPKTPKRKTVTRKIIQKDTSAAAITVPPPLILAAPIKLENVEELPPNNTTPKDSNTSMTSDMYDSLTKPPEKVNEQTRKEVSVHLNDSAVSSLAADSSFNQKPTPEKTEENTAVIDDSTKIKTTLKKSQKKNCSPAEIVGEPSTHNAEKNNFNDLLPKKTKPGKKINPEISFTPKRGRKTIHYESSPVALQPTESPTPTDGALNPSVEKILPARKSSKKSGPAESIPPTAKDDFESVSDPKTITIAVRKKQQQNKKSTKNTLNISKTLAKSPSEEDMMVTDVSIPVIQMKNKKTLNDSFAVLKMLEKKLPEEDTRVPDAYTPVTPKKGKKNLKGKSGPRLVEQIKDHGTEASKTVKAIQLDVINSESANKTANIETDYRKLSKEFSPLNSDTPEVILPILTESLKKTEAISIALPVADMNQSSEVDKVLQPNVNLPMMAVNLEKRVNSLPVNDAPSVVESLRISEPLPSVGPSPTKYAKPFAESSPKAPITPKKGRARKKSIIPKPDNKAELTVVEPDVAIESSPTKNDTSQSEVKIDKSSINEISTVTDNIKKRGRPRKLEATLALAASSDKVIPEMKASQKIQNPRKPFLKGEKIVPKINESSPNKNETCQTFNESDAEQPLIVQKERKITVPKVVEKIRSPNKNSDKNSQVVASDPDVPQLNSTLACESLKKRGRKKKVADPTIPEAVRALQGDFAEKKRKLDKLETTGSFDLEKKTIFDTLRDTQENIYFNPNENVSQTRKYTRKTTKKPVPSFLKYLETALNDNNTENNDVMAEITLIDSKHHATTSLTVPDQKPTNFYDQKPSASFESQKKLLSIPNKRRSNRGRNSGAIQRNNASITKEIDEIVASFLVEDEDEVNTIISTMDGPIRLHDVERLFSEENQLIDDFPVNETKNNNQKTVTEKIITMDDDTKKVEPITVEIIEEKLLSEHNICKELTITLTKITYSDIQAQISTSVGETKEIMNKTVAEPISNRVHRSFIKPVNVTLTDCQIEPEDSSADPPPISNEKKKIGRPAGRRKSVYMERKEALEMERKAALEIKHKEALERERNQAVEVERTLDLQRQQKEQQQTEQPQNSETLNESYLGPDDGAPKTTVRRRRKNELAAIVADQLLESFKEVDKSRINELKKLENLAYEKSEDLYMTGMRLTPTTKRKIVLSEHKEENSAAKGTTASKSKQRRSKSQPNVSKLTKKSDQVKLATSTTNLHETEKTGKNDPESEGNMLRKLEENEEPLKHNFEPATLQKSNFRSFDLSFGTFRSLNSDFNFGTRKDVIKKSSFVPGSAETSCSVDSHRINEDFVKAASEITDKSSNKSSLHRKLKKKMSRSKKEKKVETENINALRSGLESFTFGKNSIRQFGQKIFGSIGLGMFSARNAKEKKTLLSKPLLSLVKTSSDEADGLDVKEQKKDDISKKPLLRPSILSAILTHETASDAKSSRDPRLNKTKPITSSISESRKMGSFRQRRTTEGNLNTAFIKPKDKIRLSRRGPKVPSIAATKSSNKDCIHISDDSDEGDNYLAAIAQSVNKKIMTEDEEFSQTDGFDIILPAEPVPSRTVPVSTSPAEPPYIDEQSNGAFLQDDDNTNTELIDMDLEDDMSIYTSFSQDVSSAVQKSRFGLKRRRRKSVLLTSRRGKKATIDIGAPEQTFDCKICNKTFAKAPALAKHQTTFTHVTKLSEYEYLNKLNQPKDAEIEVATTSKGADGEDQNAMNEDNIKPVDLAHPEAEEEQEEETENNKTPVVEEPVEIEPIASLPEIIADIPPAEPDDSPTPAPTLNHLGIEPISSPEQLDTSYDRFQSTITSRIALSQEERLFYECCNMLKGSETPMVERTYPIVPSAYSTYDVPNKPVTPKSSERFSYLGSETGGNFQHGTAYTVKSPMSQSRTSPRHAYPKIDINQFSDISSDSNPAFPRVQHPHTTNHQSNLKCSAVGETDAATNSKVQCFNYKTTMPSSTQTFEHQQQSSQQQHDRNYQGSYYGMDNGSGVGYGASQFVENVGALTARTFIGYGQRSVKEFGAAVIPSFPSGLLETERNNATAGNDQVLTSPLHSTSSQGSTNTTTTCRMRTKAAMKGYDNFKVSIPTLGLDMQQALERSPHGGCKLTALAEIALGGEAPITPPRYQPFQIRDEVCDKQQQKPKPDINEKFAKKYQELIMNNIKPAATKTVKKKENCDSIGNKLGFKAKKKRVSKTSASDDGEDKKNPDKPKDIYEFDDSEEAIDKEDHKATTKGRNPAVTMTATEQSIVIPERPFKNIGTNEQNSIKFHTPDEVGIQIEESQMSTTSYSDRDDFNYGSMSENDGEESENEKDKASDSESNCSSARTTKTIENKCLIVGRIFKNATKNRADEKKAAAAAEPKKKLPKQELDKLFDSLRKEDATEEIAAEEPTDLEADKESALKKDDEEEMLVVSSKTKKKNPTTNKTKNPTADIKKLIPKAKQTTKSTGKKNELPSRAKSIDHDYPRELFKLQSELGMTAEDLAELIGEGKRKSQRRCAANRPRKVVETWSSDEYEDFLSTKDIIAFIEEKEKKSKKRKSKSVEKKRESNDQSANEIAGKKLSEKEIKISSLSEKDSSIKEPSVPISSAKESKPKTPKSNTLPTKKPERIVDRLLQKFNKSRADLKKTDNPSNEKPSSAIAITVRQTTRAKLRPNQKQNDLTDSHLGEAIDEGLHLPCETASQKKPTLSVKPRLKAGMTGEADSESDFESELRRSASVGKRTSKINKRRKTIAFKEEHTTTESKPVNIAATNVQQGPKPKPSAPISTGLAAKSTPEDAATTAAGRPLARRKRVASEMLYYWSSSSSDEEFGRIETNDDDLTQKGENLPKHGWIVGDSHKKLVTLLATAKGKKVTDVKEPASKKKS